MIVVGNLEFKTKKAFEQYTRDLLNLLIGKIIDSTHQHFKYFVDLLNRHPDAKSKIGCGVLSFKVIRNPINRKGPEMHLIRVDGSKVDFSWTSCVSKKKKPKKECLDMAMRMPLKSTRPWFKYQCEICKTKQGPFEAHHFNISYRAIADQFIKEHPEILDAKLTNGAGTYFHEDSKDIEELWLDYHDTIVRYQYLCKPCHKEQDKKLKVKEQNMNNITITISAPELVQAMQALTVALQTGSVKPAQVEATIEKFEAQVEKPAKAKKEPKAEVPATNVTVTSEPATSDKPTPTLEDVRTVLGNLSQSGKQGEVKKLIASFGATKLTEITSDKYAELLAAAEAL